MFLRRWLLGSTAFLWVSCVVTLAGSVPPLFATASTAPQFTDVCGVIDTDRVWAPGVYVATSCTVTVNPDVTLTVAPGAVVKFNGSTMVVNGRLLAQGSAQAPVVFTSYWDDAHGGDTDGESRSPAPGDWAKLVVNGPGSVLDHAWIGYGGAWYGYDKANLVLNTSDITIRDSVFAWSFEKGIAIAHLDPAHPLRLTGNTFQNNMQWAVYAKPDNSWADVLLTGNSSSGSSWNGFGLEGSISGTVTFSTTANFPFLAEQEVAVAAGSTLTMTPGTTFKFYGKALTIDGRLLARGALANPVIFTSFRDDAHGGNANGDDSPPEIGNWSGLVINGSGSVLDHTWIGYGGAWYGAGQANLTLADSGVSIANSVITNSFNRGIVVDGAAPAILGNQIYGNQVGLYTLNGALPSVRGNEIRNNSLTGLANADPNVPVDASSNWWGATSGPYHPTLNAAGTGNAVSDGVAFAPWYGEFAWVAPYTAAVHGATSLAWQVFGRDPAGLTASVAVRGAGDWQSLGSGLPPTGSLAWGTQTLLDGSYDLRVQFYDASRQMLAERIRRVLVLNSPGITWHAGATGASETWAAGTVHVLAGMVTIPSGAQVTVQPGAVVKAAANAGVQIAPGGSLHALGGSGSPIVFTSLADDTIGGDTNADGAATQPRPGEWLGITPFGTGQANLNQYTELRYAQAQHAGILTQNVTWTKNLLHVVSGEVVVPNGVTLTLEPGAIVKSARGIGITVQAGGRLAAQGTLVDPIQLTSLRDDAAGGDTNGDGALTGPAAGDWRGILVDGGQAVFDHVTLRYGGRPASGVWDSSAAAISARSGGFVTLANSLLREPFYEGLIAWGSGDVTFSNCVIAGADRGVNADGAAVVRLTNCTLDDNRIGVWGHGGTLQVVNTIIAHSLEAGLENALGSPLTWRYNDVWSATGANYSGVPNQTGQNGNLAVDPKLRNPGAGDYRLSYASPVIDAADGSAAPTTDLAGAARFDDPRTPNTGIPTASGAYADMGAYEIAESAPTNVDLAVTAVQGPVAVAGPTATVAWTVVNQGSDVAAGPWVDSVYLSSSAALDGSALLLGQVERSGALAPSARYDASLTQALPLLPNGSHHILVVSDNAGEVADANRANNMAAAPTLLAVDIPTLPMNTNVPGVLAAGQDRFYRLQPLQGRDILITADFPVAFAAEFYARYGALPQRDQFDARAANPAARQQVLVLLSAQSAPVGIWLHGAAAAAGGQNFTLRAEPLGFRVLSASPNYGSNAGQVTLAVQGAGFSGATQVSLTRAGGPTRAASSVDLIDPNHLNATFNLAGLAAGMYDVLGADGSQSATLAGAFTVNAGAAGAVQARVQAEQFIRPGRGGMITVEYWNDGNTDVVAPLLLLSSDNASFRLQEDLPWVRDMIQLLGINRSGPAGVLPPGGRGAIQIFFMPNTSGAGITSHFYLALPAAATSPLDWTAAQTEMRPAYLPVDAWEPIFANYQVRMGSTIGSYQAALAEAATYLSEVGVYTCDVGRLSAFVLQLAEVWGEIRQRYTLGAYGRGWPDPTDYAALLQPDGSVILHLPGQLRFFMQTADGFVGTPGEYGVLTRLDTGAFTLQETDGTLTVFRTDGKLDHVKDTNGNRMTPQYSAGRIAGLAWTNGDTVTFAYNPAGRITRVTDAVGRQTDFAYDAAGEHLLSITDASGSLGFAYVTGQGAAREHALAAITNADGSHLFGQYDAQGRLSRVATDGDAEWVTFAYDLGQVTATDKLGATTVTRLDDLGLPRQSVDGLSRSFWQERDADGNLTALVSPGGLRSTLGYDALGNLDWFRLPSGAATDLNFGRVPSRLLAAQDPAGHTQDMAYDSAGNLTAHSYPDGSRETYAYDAHGNLTEFVNRAGRAIRLTYNAQDLVTRKTYEDGARIDYVYDAHRNVTSATLTPATGAVQVTSLQYDAGDRLTRITYPNGRYVGYAYDAGGRLSQVSTPEGALLIYGYDAAGRLAQVGNPANPAQPFATYSYDAAGQVSRIDYGNGVYTAYEYDLAGRATSVVNRSVATVHSSFAYAYDTAGRIQSITTPLGTATYTYDADGQLTGATLPGHSVQYAYDAAGNRITATEDGIGATYTTNALDQYTAAGPLVFTYDAAGNLAGATGSGGGSSYTYDDEGRLIAATTPAGTFAYEYDVLGQRAAVVRNGQRTEYLVDPQGLGEVVAEYGAGGLTARYVHGQSLVGRVDASGAAAYYELDALGSVAGLSGAGGALLNQYSYLPFGQIASASETVANPFRFVGGLGILDDGSGLLSMRRRTYAPVLGRFTSPDPLRDPGANAYAYVRNSPLAFADPLGLAVTADRFGGFEDTLSYGDGPGKAAPGLSRAYEAMVIAQAPQATRKAPLITPADSVRMPDPRADRGETRSRRGPYDRKAGYGCRQMTRTGADSDPADASSAGQSVVQGDAGSEDLLNAPAAIECSINYPEGGGLIQDSNVPATNQSNSSSQQVASHDPNDIVGPAGFGPKNYVAGDQSLLYTIRFENDKAATAPAQVVRLTQTLDPSLDRGAFELVAVGFGSHTWLIPSGRAAYSTRFDVRSTLGLYVDFQAEFNTVTGELVATLTSIDPATGAIPTSLMSGFLPPNNTPPQGEGFLTYRVRPGAAAPSGTPVQAVGRVYFDDNPPIDTPTISHTLDVGYPSAAVNALPATVPPSFTVAWSGADEAGGAGIGSYDLYVAENGGPFTLLLSGATAASAVVQGQVGNSYAYYVLATDNVGHRQQLPGPAQATTVVQVTEQRVLLPLVQRGN